jgi:hypothetical protein
MKETHDTRPDMIQRTMIFEKPDATERDLEH